MRFGITLAVRSLPELPASKFVFQPIPALDRHGVDVSRDDILQNLVSREDQLLNGSTPWRGPREKSVILMQMLIEACSFPGDLILDCSAATGMFLLSPTSTCFSFLFSCEHHSKIKFHFLCRIFYSCLPQCEPSHCRTRGRCGNL